MPGAARAAAPRFTGKPGSTAGPSRRARRRAAGHRPPCATRCGKRAGPDRGGRGRWVCCRVEPIRPRAAAAAARARRSGRAAKPTGGGGRRKGRLMWHGKGDGSARRPFLMTFPKYKKSVQTTDVFFVLGQHKNASTAGIRCNSIWQRFVTWSAKSHRVYSVIIHFFRLFFFCCSTGLSFPRPTSHCFPFFFKIHVFLW